MKITNSNELKSVLSDFVQRLRNAQDCDAEHQAKVYAGVCAQIKGIEFAKAESPAAAEEPLATETQEKSGLLGRFKS
jgi:hypothetical protein